MKEFAQKKARLQAMPWHARLVYSIFLAFTLVGLVLTLGLTHSMLGLDLHELDVYYAGTSAGTSAGELARDLGDAPAAPLSEVTDADGAGSKLVLELPPEAQSFGQAEPMALRKLLEVTHFHLFSMPILLLILSHIYMLSQAGSRAKTWWITVASLATALHMTAPWVARQAPGALSVAFYASSGLGLFASYAIMCLRPLVDMWSSER